MAFTISIAPGFAGDGDLDLGFSPSASKVIFTLAVPSNGKILLGGGGLTPLGGIAMLNSDGTLDARFARKVGITAFDLVVQGDGKILLGGGFTNVAGQTRNKLARLNNDGTLDDSFNPNVPGPGQIDCMAVQENGKILVGGYFTNAGGMSRKNIARFNSDGTLDAGFNANANGIVACLVEQADGKVLLGGEFTTVNGTTRNHIARLNANGTLDTSFNPNADRYILSVVVQPDGKILLGGDVRTVGGTTRNYLARLNPDGTLDTGFNPNPNREVLGIWLQADGKILVGGRFFSMGGSTCTFISRLHANGAVDATFNANLNDSVENMAIQEDGRILVVGRFTSVNWSTRNYVARLLNGPAAQNLTMPDRTRVEWRREGTTPEVEQVTFEVMSGAGNTWTMLGKGARITGGWALTGLSLPADGFIRARGRVAGNQHFTGSSMIAQVLAVGRLPHIAVLQGGSLITNGVSTVSLGALPLGQLPMEPTSLTISNGGTADLVLRSFSVAGSERADFLLDTNDTAPILPPGSATVFAVRFQPTGDSLREAAVEISSNDGETTPFNILLSGRRLRADPSLTSSANSNVYSVAVQPDGRLLVGGDFIRLSGIPRNHLARLNADGTLDAGFSPNVNGPVYCVAVQADGKILLGGNFTSIDGRARSNLARLNADGTLDIDFNRNANDWVYCLAVQADGKILVGGQFTSIGATRNRLARLNADGTLDDGFNPNLDHTVNSVAIQSNGKILLGGSFSSVGATQRYYLARLNSDGSLDTGFTLSVGFPVHCFAFQADGKILLAGRFTTVGGIAHKYIARINASGTLDTNFNPEVNGTVQTMIVQADGTILLGGEFTLVNGTLRSTLARLFADGSLDPSFDPAMPGMPYGMALEADGKILVGGWYREGEAQTNTSLVRLLNEPGTQMLRFPDALRVQWLRSGTTPEVEEVLFEISTDGKLSWNRLGNGTRVAGGWQLTGLLLPDSGWIRARGRVTGGRYNGSSGLIELVQSYSFNTPPLARCRNTIVSAGTNCLASASIDDGSYDPDNGDTITVVQTPPGPYPQGTNLVTLTVTDNKGASNSCTATVTVVDTTPPQILCPSNLLVAAMAGANSAPVTFTVTATDFCDPNVTVACVPPSGSLFPVGTTTVQCVTTDASGNSNTCSFVVRVNARPDVAMIAPTNHATFVIPQPIVLLANATDPDGDGIAKVDFYEGTNWLGTATPGSALTWTNTPAGIYQLVAVATDNLGAPGQSAVLLVTNLAQAPFVTSTISTTNLNQSGLFGQTVTVKNPTASPFSAMRVLVQLDVASVAAGVRLWNATGTNVSRVPFVQYNQPLAAGQSVDLLIEYYVPDRRTVPAPTFTIEVVPAETDLNPTGTALAIDRVLPLADGSVLVEFSTLTNRVYYLQYSADMLAWKTALPAVTGTGSRVQWFDNGPPKTERAPNTQTNRFYRILLLP